MTIEAINELKKYTLGRKNTEKVEISILQLNRVIKALEQEPKIGHWINDECGNVICSECKRFRRDCRYGHTNYCNHCGARMYEPQESEEKG